MNPKRWTDSLCKMIDVSKWQGEIDWSAVAAFGVSGAIVKFTEGAGYVDPTARRNWAGAKAAGLVRGLYHFFHPEMEAEPQVQNVLGVLASVGGLEADDLPIFLDVETVNRTPAALLQSRVREFLIKVSKASGKRAAAYTFTNFAPLLGSALEGYDRWLACFLQDEKIPDGWPVPILWQETDKGQIPGIKGNVDLNIPIFSTPKDLRNYARASASFSLPTV